MRDRLFGAAPTLTLTIFLAPVAIGLIGTLAPAFGFHPALGLTTLSLEPWRQVLDDPALPAALKLSLGVGFGSTIAAVLIAFGLCAGLHHRRGLSRVRALLAPALAFPHAAFAIGLAFLLSPSGWIARAVSPGLTGWTQPPDLLIVNDPHGLALLIALTLKEALFLILMILAALGQVEAEPSLRAARSLGYGPVRAWLIVLAPRVYAQVRLPIYAVLAASLAVVDMALILGPSAPPPLAPLILSWATSFETTDQTKAAAGAVLQLLVVAAAIGLWRSAEILISRLTRTWLTSGHRSGTVDAAVRVIGLIGTALALGLSAASALGLLVWSLARSWSWPFALPTGWSLEAWRVAWPGLLSLATDTVVVAIASALIALVLVIACLEAEDARGRPPGRGVTWLLYAPLLLPQIGFLFGIQVLWSALRLDGGLSAVTWTHLLFVLPYVFLALSDPFRALDPRLARTSRSLGASRLATLLQIKLPLLVRPVLTALAIGFAVSVSLYLPTIFAGAGRVETLATEAVALASGGDRRQSGVVAFTQTALPFIALGLALALPALMARNRQGLRA